MTIEIEITLALSIIAAGLSVFNTFRSLSRSGKEDTKESVAWRATVDHRLDVHDTRFDKLEDLNLGATLAEIQVSMRHMSKMLEQMQKRDGCK